MNQRPCDAYVICSNPRSGTTMLCNLLRQTGIAGCPDSFFRQPSIDWWAQEWGVTGRGSAGFDANYLAAMIKEGRGNTSVFGMRLMAADRAFAMDWLGRCHPKDRTDKVRLDSAYGRTAFIHLSRHDKVAQAVSYIKAQQSGLWHRAADGSVLEQLPPESDVHYDPARIRTQVDTFAAADLAWEEWFARAGIVPLRLCYEHLAASPQDRLAEVLGFIGQDPLLATQIVPGTRQITNAVNHNWISQFRAEPSET